MADRSIITRLPIPLAALLTLVGCSQEPEPTFGDQISALANAHGQEASWVTQGDRTWVEIHPKGLTPGLLDTDPNSISDGPKNTTRLNIHWYADPLNPGPRRTFHDSGLIPVSVNDPCEGVPPVEARGFSWCPE